MAQVAELYLAGTHVGANGNGVIPVRSPVAGAHIADLPVAGDGEVNQAVTAARRAFDDYRHWSVYERAELCHRVAQLIERVADRLAHLTNLEQGKPIAEARGDVVASAALFVDSAEDARGKPMFTFRAPVGVWAGHHILELPVDDQV